MLKIVPLANNISVQRLVKLWEKRYKPDFFPVSSENNKFQKYEELIQASSLKGRALTATKLHEFLIELKCEIAKLQTSDLYAYIPNIVDLAEVKRLSHFASLVYQKLMEIYKNSSDSVPTPAMLKMTDEIASLQTSSSSWGMPRIEELAVELEPLLLEYQSQHKETKNWRTLGFLTTLLNFANQLLLRKVTPSEQFLLKPYFKFIEEQVALPWQRICAAAARHELDSPAFILVEQMFPLSSDIAQVVYCRLVQLLPEHRSRRGGLNNPGIRHSCLRDLEMFQAYLWLCVLEESMAPIEEELVELCAMVMTGVDVKWEMTELWNKILVDEVLYRVTPSQKKLLLPYTEGLKQAFFKERDRFKENIKHAPVSSDSGNMNLFKYNRNFYFP
jgi:hypothetical protein